MSTARWLQPRGRTPLLGTPAATSEPPRVTTLEDPVASSQSAWVQVLLLSLLLPTEFSVYLGSLRLSPHRIVILAAFFPCLLGWLRGEAGKLRVFDIALIAHCLWAVLSYLVRDGVAKAIESGGIYCVEALGAYMIGRVHVRSFADYLKLARTLVTAVLVLALITLPEAVTHTHFIHDVAGGILGNRPPTNMEPRLGLARAYGPFDHPILYGTFCALAISMAWNLAKSSPTATVSRIARLAGVGAATFVSLSSACMLAAAMQVGLLGYEKATRRISGRWWLLAGLGALAYATVSLISNRSGLKALVWYLTLDRHTASYRIAIWEYASDNIAAQPLFGPGMEHWVRPSWMAKSVDSYWLVLSLSYGLPAALMLAFCVISAGVMVGRARPTDPHSRAMRQSWLILFIALAMVGFTVHFWNHVMILFFFLIGAGAFWTNSNTRTEEAV